MVLINEILCGMSFIHLEPDSDSSTTSADSNTLLQHVDKTSVPLDTSIVVKRLPEVEQRQWHKTIKPLPATKITIRLVPIGSTRAITPKVLQVSSDQTVAVLMRFIAKKLRISTDSVYMYIHNTFQPTPDERLGDLYDQFRTNQELIFNYCNTVAFG